MEPLRRRILIKCRVSHKANNIVDEFVFREGSVTALEIMTSAGSLAHRPAGTNLMTYDPDTGEYEPLEPPAVQSHVSGVSWQ